VADSRTCFHPSASDAAETKPQADTQKNHLLQFHLPVDYSNVALLLNANHFHCCRAGRALVSGHLVQEREKERVRRPALAAQRKVHIFLSPTCSIHPLLLTDDFQVYYIDLFE
jgi:hypothetical protein